MQGRSRSEPFVGFEDRLPRLSRYSTAIIFELDLALRILFSGLRYEQIRRIRASSGEHSDNVGRSYLKRAIPNTVRDVKQVIARAKPTKVDENDGDKSLSISPITIHDDLKYIQYTLQKLKARCLSLLGFSPLSH